MKKRKQTVKKVTDIISRYCAKEKPSEKAKEHFKRKVYKNERL